MTWGFVMPLVSEVVNPKRFLCSRKSLSRDIENLL